MQCESCEKSTPTSGRRGRWSVACIALVLATAAKAAASSGGIVGYSGKSSSQTCNTCHSGGTAPLVRFEGPTQVNPGAVTTYRFVVKSQNAPQNFAGFDIAASGGVLAVIAGQGERAALGELTHNAPLKVNTTSKEAGWNFTWKAPLTAGTFTLFGAGNSVNHDAGQAGDRSAVTTIVVTVGGTATATALPTATSTPSAASTLTPTSTASASPSATATHSATSAPSPTAAPEVCAGDCDQNHQISAAEVTDIVAALNAAAPPPCPAADANGDGQLTASDLTRVVAGLILHPPSGCGP